MPGLSREGGSIVGTFLDTVHLSGLKCASRASWFVPLVGILMFVFAIVDASVEGNNLCLLVDALIAVGLICYRLWPASAMYRVTMLGFACLLLLASLAVHIVSLFVASSTLQTWFGSNPIAGVVLESLSLITVALIATNKIPSVCHNASSIKVWKVSLKYQVVVFLISLSCVSVFNPSLLTLPYLAILVWSLMQLSRGVGLKESLIGHRMFPNVLLAYTLFFLVTGLVLTLPVVSDSVNQCFWLPAVLGVPRVGDNAYNYACVLPAGIALLVPVILMPWWIDVIPVKKGRKLVRTLTRNSEPPSPLHHRASSVMDSLDASSIVQEAQRHETEKKLSTEKNAQKFQYCVKFLRFFLSNIILPSALVLVPLFLPSSFWIPVVLFGVLLVAFPAVGKEWSWAGQVYLSAFLVAVFITAIASEPSGAPDVLVSLGIAPRATLDTVWDRFLLLLSLVGLLTLVAVENLLSRPPTLPSSTLDPVIEEATFSYSVETGAISVWKEVCFGVTRSGELAFGLIIAIIFTAIAIYETSSAFFALYVIISLVPLWVSDSSVRTVASSCLVGAAVLFSASLLVYVSWFQSPNAWMVDLGFVDARPSQCFLTALPHVLVMLVGSLWLSLREEPIGAAKAAISSLFQVRPLLYARLGLLAPMILSLALFVTMPFDYFSALVIVCFVVQMALLLQDSAGAEVLVLILRVNVVQISLLVVTSIWVLISMIPSITVWVTDGLATATYISASELAVEENAAYLGKLTLVVALLAVSSFLVKHRVSLHPVSTMKLEERSVSEEHWPVLARALVVLSSQLTRGLMFVIFLASVYQTTLLNVVAELVICVFLILGRGWREIGLVFAIVSMLLLFLQYMASFLVVVAVTNQSLLEYLGLFWSSASIARNLAIFVACIVQRNVQHLVAAKSEPYFDTLDKYAQVIVAASLVLAAVGRGDFYSTIYVVVGTAFVVRQSVTDRRMSSWSFRVVAVIVGVCVAAQLLLRLWFPPICAWCPSRPDVGLLCDSSSVACKDDWERYFSVPTNSHGSTALIDDDVARQQIATSLGLPQQYTIPVIKGYGLLWDFLVLWVVCVLCQNHQRRHSVARTAQSSSDSAATARRSRRQRVVASLLRFLARGWIVVVQILALLSCFTFRETVDLVTVLFLGFTVTLAWVQQKRLQARRRAVVAGVVISLIVVMLTVGYQIPVFVCKYGPAGSPHSVPTMMCLSLQDLDAGSENYASFSTAQVVVQVIGLMKSNVVFTATPFPMTVGPCILLLAALLVQLALYDHSATYKRIDALCFDRELRLNAVRARRFIAEFNAKLLIENRKVACALEATRRKLVRVQDSAETLLRIFYSRLAGVGHGELVRSTTDHLSNETESVSARGFSVEEAEIAVSLSKDSPEGTALLLLENAMEFALLGTQESDVIVNCKSLLDPDSVYPSRWSRMTGVIKKWLSTNINDVAYVSDENAAEPLSLHRRNDSILTLSMKALFSNSFAFVVFFSVLAFVATNSLVDLIRVFVVLGTIPVWPFANRKVMRVLLWYSALVLVLKAVYQLPVFCGAGSGQLWRGADAGTVAACDAATTVGWDVILGIPKMIGSSAVPGIETTSFFTVAWQDILVIIALLWYRALLYRTGVWEHILVGRPGRDSGAVLVPRQRHAGRMETEESFDVAAGDADEPVDDDATVELGLDESVTDLGDVSPVGSFVDVFGVPLDADDSGTLWRYAVQRHMSCEDVASRIVFSSDRHWAQKRMTQLISIYKQLRWEAQRVFANHECVRLPASDREAINVLTSSGLSVLPKLSSWYVRINPFYATKTGSDYYVWFFTVGLMMFFHVVIFYPSMVGQNANDFVSSLKQSRFSAGLALLMLFHFALIIFDRAYYVASFRRSAHMSGSQGFVKPSNHQVTWFFVRLLTLVALSATLHGVTMNQVFKAGVVTYEPLMDRTALAVYYLEFMVYLSVAVLQVREGFPRVMSESLRPEKSYHPVTDKIQEIRFLIYRAIPFLDEIRILVDWTVAKTCLDLFQYFKLEDAHTYMWQTKREMETRKKQWPAEPIGKAEKGFMGCGFLALLVLIVIGPVLLFSTLVSPGELAPVTKALLTVSVVAETCPGCTGYVSTSPMARSELVLFSATPSVIRTLSDAESVPYFPNGRLDVEEQSSVQAIDFERESEVDAGLRNAERFATFASMVSSAVVLNIETVLSFERSVGVATAIRMPACACASGFETLCMHCSDTPNTPSAFAAMQTAVNSLIDPVNSDLAIVPHVLSPVVKIDSTGTLVDTSSFGNATMAIAVLTSTGYVAGWNGDCGLVSAGICPGVPETLINANGTDISFTFILAPVAPNDGAGGALLSIGIVTVYITIVYAIGRFLRLVFDKESLRVIYLEIPRPDDFLDLATGATIARHFKDLPMEFRLYNCLIKVMRSPETLIALGGADLTGYGAYRRDDPPFPDLLAPEDQDRIRRRRRRKSRKQ